MKKLPEKSRLEKIMSIVSIIAVVILSSVLILFSVIRQRAEEAKGVDKEGWSEIYNTHDSSHGLNNDEVRPL